MVLAADFNDGEFPALDSGQHFTQANVSAVQAEGGPIKFLENHFEDFAAIEADFDLEGNSAAQFELARTFQSGSKGVVDPQQAMVLYHLSAENGYKPAQKYLATAYRDGLMGIEKNQMEARIWSAMYSRNQ